MHQIYLVGGKYYEHKLHVWQVQRWNQWCLWGYLLEICMAITVDKSQCGWWDTIHTFITYKLEQYPDCGALQILTSGLFWKYDLYLWLFSSKYGICSTNFCDRLLVESDVFYHFRGIILCNAKRLPFYLNKKQ